MRSPSLRILSFVLVSWCVWGLLYTANLHTVKETPVDQSMRYALPDALIWALFTPVVIGLSFRFPVIAPAVVRRLLLHLAFALVLVFAHSLLDGFQHQFTTPSGAPRYSVGEFLINVLPKTFHSNLMVYVAVAGIVHVFERQRRVADQRTQLAALRADLSDARLSALRLRLQPHFLFNCLNGVAALTESDPKRARTMVTRLCQLLRRTLENSAEETTLAEDLAFVRDYLELEVTRFGDRLCWSEEVEAELDVVRLPSLLLQPLVENAVRHGAERREGGTQIVLSAHRAGGDVVLTVEDRPFERPGSAPSDCRNGSDVVLNSGLGIGLRAVEERLAARYGRSGLVQLHASHERATAEVRLPAAAPKVTIASTAGDHPC